MPSLITFLKKINIDQVTVNMPDPFDKILKKQKIL